MLQQELKKLFFGMPQVVKDKLQPVMDIILERAEDLDNEIDKSTDAYAEEHELIMKEVHKVKYLNDQWQIMNAKKNN